MITQDVLPRSAGVKVNAHGLVVFDLDGTLLRGQTVCEVLAAPLGRLEEMNTFESLTEECDIAQARVEMAQWYRAVPREQLVKSLASARWAPGAFDGVARLVRGGIAVAVASITWDFAVSWFAHQLGLTHVLGTKIDEDGTVKHVWPRNKGEWLRELASVLAVPSERTAAVGDSTGDLQMLQAAALRFFVGSRLPPGLTCIHVPDGNIEDIAKTILTRWSPKADPVTAPQL
jgi:phosphoserine phosphatase